MKKLTLLILQLAALTLTGHAAWYVDRAALPGGDGKSWETAWTNCNDIRWTSVSAGHTIYFSGGPAGSAKYYGQFKPGKSGTYNSRITVRPSRDEGHNGKVILNSVSLNSKDYITFDGALDDNYPIPSNTFDMWQITNNIGLFVTNNSWNGVYGTRFGGITLKWMQIGPVGNPAAVGDESSAGSGVILNSPTLLTNSEIAYCYINHVTVDGFNNNGVSGGNHGDWDAVRIHHNVIHTFGDDGFQCGTSGFTIHNNIIGQRWLGSSVGHPDNIQQTFIARGKLRVYNNILYNTWNAWKYSTLGASGGGFIGEVQFYGNLCYMERNWPGVSTMNYGVHHAAWGNFGNVASTTMQNVFFINNTLYYAPSEGLVPFYRSYKSGHVLHKLNLTNVICGNNLVLDCSTPPWDGGALSVEGPGWTQPTSTNGTHYSPESCLVEYNCVAGINPKIRYGPQTWANGEAMSAAIPGLTNWSRMPKLESTNTYDFRIAAGDTSLTDTGKDYSYLIEQYGMVGLNVDLWGNPRGQNGAWDVGANEFTPASAPDTNLVVHITFDDDLSDGIADDSSGYNNHGFRFGREGTMTNWPTVAIVTNNGVVGQGAYFEYWNDGYGEYGRSGDYVGLTTLNAGNVSQATVMLWARYAPARSGSWVSDHNATLIDNGRYQTPGSWRIGRENFWSGAQFNNRTKLTLWTNTTVNRLQLSFGDPGDSAGATDAMRHYAWVFDNGTNRIYRNGALVSEAVTSQKTIQLNAVSHWIGIGAWPHHGSSSRDPYLTSPEHPEFDEYPNTFWFRGWMDDIRIYTRALSGAEIAQIAGTGGVAPDIGSATMPFSATNGTTATWSVTLAAGTLPVTYTLTRSGVQVFSTNVNALAASFTKTVTYGDTGTYQWTVGSQYGADTSASYPFTVYPEPGGEPEPEPPPAGSGRVRGKPWRGTGSFRAAAAH
jgi:hypothetical protein